MLRSLCASTLALLFIPAIAMAQSPEARRIRIAVLPVTVNSSSAAEYLQQGLADMLSARLGQHEGMAVIRVDDASRATMDPGAARETGRALGADFVLFGSFTRFGEGASLDVLCLPVAAAEDVDPRSIFIQSGSLGELIPRLDALVTRVAYYVDAGPKASLEPGEDFAARDRSLRDALAELDSLRERVGALEHMALGAEDAASATDPHEPVDSGFDRAFEELESEGDTSQLR